MTDPTPAPDETTEPTPDIGALLIAAARELIAAQRARPRDPARIQAARDELARLQELNDAAA